MQSLFCRNGTPHHHPGHRMPHPAINGAPTLGWAPAPGFPALHPTASTGSPPTCGDRALRTSTMMTPAWSPTCPTSTSSPGPRPPVKVACRAEHQALLHVLVLQVEAHGWDPFPIWPQDAFPRPLSSHSCTPVNLTSLSLGCVPVSNPALRAHTGVSKGPRPLLPGAPAQGRRFGCSRRLGVKVGRWGPLVPALEAPVQGLMTGFFQKRSGQPIEQWVVEGQVWPSSGHSAHCPSLEVDDMSHGGSLES